MKWRKEEEYDGFVKKKKEHLSQVERDDWKKKILKEICSHALNKRVFKVVMKEERL